jgi:signal transduction histidine kinase
VEENNLEKTRLRLVLELFKDYPTDWSNPTGAPNVIRTGKSELYSEVSEDLLKASAKNDQHWNLIKDLEIKSAMVVPVVARGNILGAITLISSDASRKYDEHDLFLAEELGRRAGIAIESALLYKKAQDAIQHRDEFLSIASHELKTPLTTLKFQIQLFERESRKENPDSLGSTRIREKLNLMDKNVRRLNRLIEDLLDISRIQHKKITFQFEEIDLSALVNEVAQRFLEEAQAQGMEIIVNDGPKTSGFWDRLRIEQALSNLLSNAIKYGRPSSGLGKIEMCFKDLGSSVQVEIKDEGLGIPDLDKNRIFERFERAVPINNYGGLGLGLYITKEIVEGHKGKIWVESKTGAGATFILQLPKSPSGLQNE